MSDVKTRVLEGLGPALREAAGPVLEDLVDAATLDLEVTDALTRPTDRGWAAVVDLDTTPDPAWVGRVTGTTVPPGLTLEQQRAYVRDRPSWRRGTLDAIAAAVLANVADGARVAFLERYQGNAWHLALVVEVVGGADEATVLAAVATQKPVGLVIDGVELTEPGDPEADWTPWWRPAATTYRFARLKADYATFADLTAAFPTFADLRDHNPQET